MDFFVEMFSGNESVQITLDLGLALFGFIALFFYCMSLGRRNIILIIFSLYFAFVLMKLMDTTPFISFLLNFAGAGTAPALAILYGQFIIFVGIAYLLLSGSVLPLAIRFPRRGDAAWWHVIFLSIIASGFFMANLIYLLPAVYELSSPTKWFFAGNYGFLWWAIAPIIVLALIRKKEAVK